MRDSLLRTALLILAISPALAGTEPVSDGLRRCALQTDEKQRLACFDALVTALPSIKTQQFGMTPEIARKQAPASLSSSESEKLSAKITALHEARSGELVFTLDNDQVWMQAEPQSNLRFFVGDAVQLEYGALGSLWLTADHHRKTKVKRIR
jgi:hypothetical protein